MRTLLISLILSLALTPVLLAQTVTTGTLSSGITVASTTNENGSLTVTVTVPAAGASNASITGVDIGIKLDQLFNSINRLSLNASAQAAVNVLAQQPAVAAAVQQINTNPTALAATLQQIGEALVTVSENPGTTVTTIAPTDHILDHMNQK